MMQGEQRQCWQYDAPWSCVGVLEEFLYPLGLVSTLVVSVVGFMDVVMLSAVLLLQVSDHYISNGRGTKDSLLENMPQLPSFALNRSCGG